MSTKYRTLAQFEISYLKLLERTVQQRQMYYIGQSTHRQIECDVFEIVIRGDTYGGGNSRYLIFAEPLSAPAPYTHRLLRVRHLESWFSISGLFELYHFEPIWMDSTYDRYFDISLCSPNPYDQAKLQLVLSLGMKQRLKR